MGNTTLIRTALLIALIVAFGFVGRPAARRQASHRVRRSIQVVASDSSSRFVPLGVGKSVVIDLPRDIKDVLVADPKIANAVVRSSRRAYIIGVEVGQTNVFFFDAEGQQIAGFDIAVTRDLNGLRAAHQRRRCPICDIHVEGSATASCFSGNCRPARSKRSRPSTCGRLIACTGRADGNERSSTASPSTAATRSCSR